MAREHMVQVRLQAVTSQYEQAMARAKKATSALGATSDETVKTMGADLHRLGGFASRYVTLPIMAAGTAAVWASANFERSMNRVRGITRATSEEFEALNTTARNLGRDTQYTATQVGEGMRFLAMAGFEAMDVVSAMPSVLELAAVDMMDLARAADITTNILTGYGMSVEELGHANDVLALTMTSSNTNLVQLGEAMKYAAPIARGAGISFEETAAAMGLMGNAGLQASLAGTSMRSALSRLMSPTDAVQERMDALGLSVKDSAGNLVSFTEILRRLEGTGASVSDIMQIFGLRAGPAMAALLTQGSGALAKLTRELENSEGTAAALAAVNLEGFSGGLLKLKSAAEAFGIALTDAGLLSALTWVVDRLTDLTRLATMMPGPLMNVVVAFGLLLAAVGPIARLTGGLIKNWEMLVRTMSMIQSAAMSAGTAFGNLARTLGPAGLTGVVGVALAGVSLLGAYWMNNAQKAREAEQAHKRLTRAIRDAGDVASGIAGRLEDMLSTRQINVLDALGISAEHLTTVLSGTDTQWQMFMNRITTDSLAAASGSAPSLFLTRHVEVLRKEFEDLREKTLKAAEAAEVMDRVFGDSSSSATDAAYAMMTFGEEAYEAAGGIEDASTKLDRLTTRLSEYASNAFNQEKATLRWLDSIEKLRGSVEENGTSLNFYTKEGKDNFETMMGLVEATMSMINLRAEEGASVKELIDLQVTYTEGLRTFGRELGFADEDLQFFINTILNMPTAREIEVSVDVDKALFDIERMNASLRRLNNLLPSGRSLGSMLNNPAGYRAMGGPVQAGQPYVVNEHTARSEIFVPATSGAIFTQAQFNQMLASGNNRGGGVNVNVNVDGRKFGDGEVEMLADYVLRKAGWQMSMAGVR